MNKFNKVVGYKINRKKSVVCTFANGKSSEIQIKKIIPLRVSIKIP